MRNNLSPSTKCGCPPPVEESLNVMRHHRRKLISGPPPVLDYMDWRSHGYYDVGRGVFVWSGGRQHVDHNSSSRYQ